MVNVVTVGNTSAMDHLLFPDVSPISYNYIQNQFNNLTNYVCDTTKKFFEDAKSAFEKLKQTELITRANLALTLGGNLFHHNSIVYFNDIQDIRNAQPVMQRWIMAEPTIRNLYIDQRCSGYVDTYVDMQPNTVGIDNYDYRRVTDGVIMFDQDGEAYRDNHYELLLEGDRDLTAIEQHNILGTWDVVKMFIDAGEDPTDVLGGKL